MTFPEEFLEGKYKNILIEGNTISVIGIVNGKSSKENVLEIDYVVNPIGLKLIREESNKTEGISNILNLLKQRGNRGAYEFEEIVELLFRKKGYNTKLTKRSGDYGIDVIAEKQKEKIAIQCKLNDPEVKVSNSIIQKALGSLTSPYEANKLIVVTTSNKFTAQAEEQGKTAKVPVELWNKDKFILEYNAYVKDLEEAWDILNKEGEISEDIHKEIGFFDIDKISGKFSSSQRNKIIVRDTITDLESKLGKRIPIEEIEKELESKLSKEEIEEAITKLSISGDIFKPRRGYISLS